MAFSLLEKRSGIVPTHLGVDSISLVGACIIFEGGKGYWLVEWYLFYLLGIIGNLFPQSIDGSTFLQLHFLYVALVRRLCALE